MPFPPITVAPSAYTYPLLIKQLLHTALATAPEQEIVYKDARRHTYVEFHHRLKRLANTLTTLGVQPGSTVAVMDWDSHRYLEAFFGIPMMGATLMMVNVRLSPEQIAYTLNHSGATVLLANQEFLPILDGIRPQLANIKTVILMSDETTPAAGAFAGEYESLLASASDQFDFPEFDENTRATTFYTTGTTGAPKGVYFSHRQLVLHTLGVGNTLAMGHNQGRIHREDVYMPLTPMFHVHAWGMPYIATLSGMKQVYPGRYHAETILKLIDREKVSFTHCVPTVLNMLLNDPYSPNVDLSNFKVIIGGSALTTSLTRAAMARGVDVFSGYGMSETCPIMALSYVSTDDLAAADEKQVMLRAKTGRPVALVDLRAVDAQMQSVPRDGKTAGEIVVRAPWLTQGYLNNPTASEDLWRGGWLHTQDIGHFDAQGYLQVTDRIKDVIKSGGEWISSLELEEMINSHPGVSEVAVIGVRDEKWGERPLALVVLRPEFVDKVTTADITAHVRAYSDRGLISPFAVPENIMFIESLNRTSVGKLDKVSMRKQHV
jgi:fatty-acyl-CoA synthase